MEGLAALTGFLCWKKLFPKYWRAFPFYLLLITCFEFTGWYMNSHGYKPQAKMMYSYFVIPLEFLFMYFLYSKCLNKIFHKILFIFFISFVLSFFTEYLILRGMKWDWMSLTYMTGSITILILSVLYVLQLIAIDKVIHFRHDLFFWVNLGIMLFYVGTFPYYVTANYLYKINVNMAWVLSWMVVILNYIMYTFFIIGFLCSRKQQLY